MKPMSVHDNKNDCILWSFDFLFQNSWPNDESRNLYSGNKWFSLNHVCAPTSFVSSERYNNLYQCYWCRKEFSDVNQSACARASVTSDRVRIKSPWTDGESSETSSSRNFSGFSFIKWQWCSWWRCFECSRPWCWCVCAVCVCVNARSGRIYRETSEWNCAGASSSEPWSSRAEDPGGGDPTPLTVCASSPSSSLSGLLVN